MFARRLHAVQFISPKVAHSERGQDLLTNFLHHVAVDSSDVDKKLHH